ncbi:unnamed protein product [Cuscuta europaea]|uniref:Transposase, Ptta/En/Spm, plant n=1 Tax=Cuscuta europaea TaxID=41803 RepID=A0A9P0ZZW6_CUSEU|nr:unnamed protein product [Cuscuta europaea]
MDSQEHEDASTTQNDKKRGVTLMKKCVLKRACANEKIFVQFDESNNPIGPNRPKLISFVGYLGRNNVDINIANWRRVSKVSKDLIWEDIQIVFEIPDTKSVRKRMLKIANKAWKDFKSKLSTKYVYGKKKNEDPLKKYNWITEEQWSKFVESRRDPEFRHLSDKGKELQLQNVYKHRLSRGGYYMLEQDLIKKKQQEQELAAISDPSFVCTPITRIPRHILWKGGRIGKDGQFMTEESREVAEKIDSFEHQASIGEFTECGRNDILSASLEKSEHPGRVRGVGGEATITEYFGRKSRSDEKHLSAENVQQMVSKAVADAEFRAAKTFESRMGMMQAMQQKWKR